MKKVYKVEGMTCGGCVKSVDRVVRAAAPGAAVEVSLEAGTVTVEGDHDASAIAAAVEGAGFDFAGEAP